MNAYRSEGERIDRMWTRLEARLDAYPPALRALADRFRASIRAADRIYFSFTDAAPLLYLPIWLRRARDEAVDDILEATALLYWYVRIQDNVVDEPEERGHAPYLLLANALHWDAMALLPFADAEFSRRARDAWLEFSEQTEAERVHISERRPYGEADFARHARKVALAEVPIYATMAASGDWSGVDRVAPLIHALGRAYGLVNDVLGHERDLRTNGHTYLLAGLADPRRELLASDRLEGFLDRAARHHEEAREHARALGMTEIEAYTEERKARLAGIRDTISLLRLGASLNSS